MGIPPEQSVKAAHELDGVIFRLIEDTRWHRGSLALYIETDNDMKPASRPISSTNIDWVLDYLITTPDYLFSHVYDPELMIAVLIEMLANRTKDSK